MSGWLGPLTTPPLTNSLTRACPVEAALGEVEGLDAAQWLAYEGRRRHLRIDCQAIQLQGHAQLLVRPAQLDAMRQDAACGAIELGIADVGGADFLTRGLVHK